MGSAALDSLTQIVGALTGAAAAEALAHAASIHFSEALYKRLRTVLYYILALLVNVVARFFSAPVQSGSLRVVALLLFGSLGDIRFDGTPRWLQIARFVVDALAGTFGVVEKAQLGHFHVVSARHVVDSVQADVKVEIYQFGSFWFAFLCSV